MRTIKLADNKHMRLTLTTNVDDVEAALVRVQRGPLEDLSTFYTDYLGPEAYLEIRLNFETEGGFVGGWRALSPGYAAWKLAHYGRKPILVRTGALKTSLSGPRARGAVFKVDRKSMVLSSQWSYINTHQRGIGVPRRQVLFNPNPVTARKLFKTWMLQQMKQEGLTA